VHGSTTARRAGGVIVAVALALAACGGGGRVPSGAPTSPALGVSESPLGVSESPWGVSESTQGPVEALRYVALGDSYTIGTSVGEDARWPNQLVEALGGSAGPLQLVANLGVNGFTAEDVVAAELPRLGALQPGFATVLVGVNDVVQGVPEAAYRAHLGTILDALEARLPANRIFVVTTPDYTVTPAGADYGDPDTQRAAIRRANAILTEVADARGIAVVDIFDISERAPDDPALVARDGLHPSGRQYGLWVERIAPAVRALLDRP
jgi:acyl-CoA thioesterase I